MSSTSRLSAPSEPFHDPVEMSRPLLTPLVLVDVEVGTLIPARYPVTIVALGMPPATVDPLVDVADESR